MSFLGQSVPLADLQTWILDALETSGSVDVHHVKNAVRAHAPETRLFVVSGALLSLSGEGRVVITGEGQAQRYRRRV